MVTGPQTGNFSAGGGTGRSNDDRNDRKGNPKIKGGGTVTEVTTDKFDNGVVDVSIIPYMRSQLVQFEADGLRPNRRVFFYFDDVNVTDYIIKTDELELVQNNDVALYNSGFSNNDTLSIGTGGAGNSASVVQVSRFFDFVNATESLRDDAKPRKRKRILKLANTSGRFANAQGFLSNVVGSVTGTETTIGAIRVQGGETLNNFFQDTSSNSVTLPIRTRDVANDYWGTDGSNTIILMPRKRAKGRTVRAYITGFNNVNQQLFLANTLSSLIVDNPNADLPSGNSSNQISWTIGDSHFTDFEGKISGTFSIPAGLFRTGERVFRIIDDLNNDPADSTTRAEYRFVSSGLQVEKNDVVINTTKTTVLPEPPTQRPRQRQDEGGPRTDPIAQTFFVNELEYPNGMFLSAVGLYFYNKDEILPVTVQIRPTVNGYPHSYDVIPYAESSLASEFITTSTDASVETKIKFDSPIYLEPGEYALVVKSDSLEYEVFVSELGSKIIGSDRIVSKQPYLGSFFKSQNASTWDAIQLEDLTFNLYKCVFDTSGTVTFFNEAPSSNVFADSIYAHIDDKKIPNTAIAYTHSYAASTPTESYIPDTNYKPLLGRVDVDTIGGLYRLQATLQTSDTNVSPVVYNKSGQFLAIENFIENANVTSEDFTIVNPGYYSANINGTVPLTITDYRGSGIAIATANVNSTGNLSNIRVTTGGSGFVNTATVVVAVNNAVTSNAIISMSSETATSGGPALAKYISRTVTLAEGFDAGDLRVFVTAYKPTGTDIKVYYKVRAADDPDSFESKSYILMNQKTKSTLYSLKNDYNSSIEYEFEPYDATNTISYSTSTTTYNSFNQYAIKIVLLSDDTTNVPIAYDMRAIALPAMGT
jgi:hypothetical protein